MLNQGYMDNVPGLHGVDFMNFMVIHLALPVMDGIVQNNLLLPI